MPIQDWQIQDLINKTNIVYNVVNNTLNTPLSNVLANVINGTNQIQNRLTQSQQQATSLTQYQINTVGSYINGLGNRVYSDINFAVNGQSQAIQAKLNAVNAAIHLKIDSTEQKIQKRLDVINADLKDVIGGILLPIREKIEAGNRDITNNLNNSINTLQVNLKSANIQTQNTVTNAQNAITTAIKNASITTAQQNNNQTPITPSTNSFVAGDPLYNNLLSLLGNINQSSLGDNDGSGGISAFLLKLITGGQLDANATTPTLPNFGGAITDQIHQITTIIDKTSRGDYKTLDQFYTDFKKIGVDTDFVGGILQLLFIIPSLLNIGSQLTGAFNVRIAQLTNSTYELKQLDESEIVMAFIRNLIDYETAITRLKEIGHERKDAELILKEAFPKFTIQDYFRLAHLGKISPKTLTDNLRTLGFNEIDAILQGYLNEVRPTVYDLISFSVKEVYSPETTQLFGQFQDFPQQFSKEAQLLGLSEDSAKKFWAAHWQLPGAAMGYDMFHRRLITYDQLKALLKALDVMPFWRDKLINLAYNVVGRVDTRRLYAYDIWDAKKVYENYLDQGYKPEDAQSLTQFTIAYDKDHEDKHTTAIKKKTHDVYIKSYLAGLINKEQAIQHLTALGYKREDVILELNLEDYEDYVNAHAPKNANHTNKLIQLSSDGYRKKSLARADFLGILTHAGYSLAEANTEADFIDKEADIIWKETLTKEIQKLYFESLIDDNGVLSQLISFGFSNSEALHIISQLQILKKLDAKKPTQAQFKAMFEGNIISEQDYARELADMGYNQKYIPALIKLSTG